VIGEQPDVDQRGRQRDLSSDEQRQRRSGDNTDHRDVDAKKPVGGTFLHGVHEAEHADKRQSDAGRVPRPRRRVAVLRQQDDAASEQHYHHRRR